MEIKQNWFRLTTLQVGFLICLPAILLGSYLSQIYGYIGVLGGIFIAGVALCIYAFLQYRVSQNYPGLSTVDIAKHYFSTTGFMFSSTGFSFSLCGWFVIQLNMMARAVCSVYPSLSSIAVSCILGFLMTVIAIRGIKILESFANIVFFPMCMLLVYTLWVMPTQTLSCSAGKISFACIISLISSAIATVVDVPTYYRFAASQKDAYISFFLVFLVFLPLVTAAGVYMAMYGGSGDVIQVLLSSEKMFDKNALLIFLLLAGWTTNNGNIYSGVVALEPLTKSLSMFFRTILFGCFATICSIFFPIERFELLLMAMGVIIVAMSSIMCVHVCFLKKKNVEQYMKYNDIVLLFASCIGFYGIFFSPFITSCALLDVLSIGFFSTLLLGVK